MCSASARLVILRRGQPSVRTRNKLWRYSELNAHFSLVPPSKSKRKAVPNVPRHSVAGSEGARLIYL